MAQCTCQWGPTSRMPAGCWILKNREMHLGLQYQFQLTPRQLRIPRFRSLVLLRAALPAPPAPEMQLHIDHSGAQVRTSICGRLQLGAGNACGWGLGTRQPGRVCHLDPGPYSAGLPASAHGAVPCAPGRGGRSDPEKQDRPVLVVFRTGHLCRGCGLISAARRDKATLINAH